MSKKKSKNSNYKNDPTVNRAVEDKKKDSIIVIVCAVIAVLLVGGIIAAMLMSGNGDSGNRDQAPTQGANADPAKTEVMGTGSCEHLETRDITDREVSYVEFTFQNYGKIVVLVDATTAPQTVANFLSLVKGGFYNGLTIFRAQENFVIQGGENKSVNLQPIPGEFDLNGHPNDISHIRGVISMARTDDPDSATSQFFITLHDSAVYSLDGKYAAFGYVVKGMSVVDEIAEDLINAPSSGSMGFVGDRDAITILSAKILEEYQDNTSQGSKPAPDTNADPAKTEVMGTGACEYLETRDITDREVSYVELKFKDYGRIVVLVDATTAPQTAANFLSLVNDGFYDGLTIFRAQENFVIQGGENRSVALQPIPGEFDLNGHPNDISHIRGVISMARTNDPDSATSQFFITLHDSAVDSLDGMYASFGYVVKGMSVVDEIAEDLINAPSSGSMGFVGDSDAVTIVSATVLEEYTPD